MANRHSHFKHVLLVDDSDIDVLVNRRLIELTNFASTITITRTGEEALRFLREECNSADSAPDWIFLDMYLPVMSGFDFIEEFKLLPSYIQEKSRIIILSVFQKKEKIQEILDYHFIAGQVDKPLTQQTLNELAQQNKIRVSASS